MFQFHTGSIKSLSPLRGLLLSCMSFNSILVRLKGNVYPTPKHSEKGFNSILVRLKVTKNMVRGEKIWFQFHTGSIKRLDGSR